MKRTKRVFLFVFFVGLALFNARAFDFSAVSSSGQTLYYTILTDSTVAVVYPNHVGNNYYSGYSMPIGSVNVPSSVLHGGNWYTVTTIGNNAFTGCAGMTGLTLPGSLTTIGNSACSQCTGLLSLNLPNSLTSIGDNAFMGCSHLGSIVLPNAVTMVAVGTFQGCSSLSSVTFGPSVTTIGNVAFEGCSSLTSLHIPDAVALLGNWAFCNCTSLDSIYIGNSVAYILQNTFSGCNNVHYIHYNARNASCSYYAGAAYHSSLPVAALTQLIIGDSVQSVPQYSFAEALLLDTLYIGEGVSSVDANAFLGTTNVHYLHYNTGHFSDLTFPVAAFAPFSAITHLTVGSNVQHVPSRAFTGKTNLQQVSFSSSVTSVGDSAFLGCAVLQGPLSLPSGLTSVGVSAFQGCSNMSGALTLPPTLLSIGDYAFANCSKINGALSLPAVLQSLGNGAFADCDSILSLTTNSPIAIPADAFNSCDRLFQVSLHSATTNIGPSAFANCVRLSELSLGNTLTSIGSNAFNGCVRLANPSIPNSINTIGDSAFIGCILMGGNLTFPASVTSIGDYAFANISPITSIEMRGSNPPTIYSHTFASATLSTPVFVPCAATVNYRLSDYWEDFINLSESTPFVLSLVANDTAMGSAVVLQQPTCSNYLAIVQATANAGYHFLRWTDGNTSNPRLLLLSSDTTLTAFFVSDNSLISVASNDATRGYVSGGGIYSYNDTAILTASPYADYHFQRWSDGSTQNPRQVIVTQDSQFVAIFLSNISTLALTVNNPTMGTVSGAGSYSYLDQAVISATPFYGYHFTMWNDGVTANPRIVSISQDTSFTALFDANTYSVTVGNSSPSMGSVSGAGTYTYLDTALLSAVAGTGHHFVQWSDGNTDNPRLLLVTSDTVLSAQFVPNAYLLTVVPSDTTLGTVSGGGTYNYNTTVTIYAIPAEGCHFTQWNDGNTSNPRTIVVTSDASFTAQFAVNVYSIMVSSANTLWGSVSGGGSYSHNAVATLTATAASGCHFTQWNDGNTDNPRSITVTQNASYIAQFAVNSYSVTVSTSNSALGIVTGSGTYSHNSTAVLTATPNYGFHFVQWNDGNTDNPRSIIVTHDVSYTALFDTNQYVVSAISSNLAGGSVTGGGTYSYLSQALLTAVPVPHYHFVQWNDSLTNNPRTIMVLSDTQLVADFQIDSHNVSVAASNPTMGQTSGSGVVAYGTNLYISATPNYGYRFTGWSDGVSLNPRRIVVSSDTAFTALFVANNYTATVTSNNVSLGVVSGGGTYSYLTSLTLTATPFGSCRFVGWSDGNTDNPRTLVLISDTVLQAQFVVNTCRLDCESSDPTMGIVSGSGTYDYMAQVPVLATAYPNHHFVHWSDGVTTNPRLVTLTSDTMLVAYFAQEPSYTITVTSADNQMGTVTGSGVYHYGEEVRLTAIPNEHFHFSYWTDGNSANPRTVHVIADASYTAVFSPDMYTITLTANNSSWGAVYGGGQYAYGEEAVLTAVPFPSAHFRSWSDGSNENPRTIVVTRNITLQALFGDELGIGDRETEEHSFEVSAQDLNIHVIGASGKAVTIYDLYGRQVAFTPHADSDYVVTMPAAGVYLVRPEGCKPKKVVVL